VRFEQECIELRRRRAAIVRPKKVKGKQSCCIVGLNLQSTRRQYVLYVGTCQGKELKDGPVYSKDIYTIPGYHLP